MRAASLARHAWQRLAHESPGERVSRTMPHPERSSLVRSGVAAGATIVAVSVASAVTSAIRRRVEGT